MVTSVKPPGATFFSAINRASSSKDDAAGVERWIHLAQNHDVKLRSLPGSSSVQVLARCGHPERAERLLISLHKDNIAIDTSTYNLVVSAFAKQGDADGAERVVRLMCEHEVEPDVVTLGAAVHASAKDGMKERAEAIFDLILHRGKTQPDAVGFNALINASVKAGDTKRAELWLSKMIEVGVAPSVVSYTTVLHAHARNGDIDAADKCLASMQQTGVEANVVSYTALIHACVKAGDIPRAERWFEVMQAAGIQANAVSYSSLLNVCAKAGDYERAEKWLVQMCRDGVAPTEVCFNNVIDACAKANCPERAEAWLWRLAGKEDSAEDAPALEARGLGLAPTRQSFTSAAQAYGKLGFYKQVERLLEKMEDYGMAMDEFSLTVQLSAYGRARPRQREYAEAAFRRHHARKLPITRPAFRVLKSLLTAGRLQELLEDLKLKAEDLPEFPDNKKPRSSVSRDAELKAQRCMRPQTSNTPHHN